MQGKGRERRKVVRFKPSKFKAEDSTSEKVSEFKLDMSQLGMVDRVKFSNRLEK